MDKNIREEYNNIKKLMEKNKKGVTMDKKKDKELIKTVVFNKFFQIEVLAYNQGKYRKDEELYYSNQSAIRKLKQEIYQLLTEN